MEDRFTYTTYIAVKPEKLWNALIDSKTTKKYWQHVNASDWKPGSPWKHRRYNIAGPVDLAGKVVEFNPPRRLVLTWAAPEDADREDRHSVVIIDIEPYRGVSRMTVTHERLEPGSDMFRGVSEGWPMVLASLKSLMEKGKALPVLWEDEGPEAVHRIAG